MWKTFTSGHPIFGIYEPGFYYPICGKNLQFSCVAISEKRGGLVFTEDDGPTYLVNWTGDHISYAGSDLYHLEEYKEDPVD